MKILHIITSLSTGGAEKLVTEIVPKLRAMGHEVDVCLFDGTETPFKKQLAQCGCKIYSLSYGGNVYNPLHIIRLWRLMRHYDLVHTHNTAPQFFAALAAKVLCSVVLVTTEHNTSNRRRDWRWYPRYVDRWMYKQYKHVICISDQAEENLRKYLNDNENEKIITIYNGVDVEAFHSAPVNEELRNSTSRFVIVMVAGFRYQKDQDTLIKAMALLPKDRFELWLVGDGVRAESLKMKVESCGATDNVRFLGLRTDVPRILKAADVVVMSSHFEGLSLSNIEGMAAGKPFVASDVDGLREVTKGYGLLFPHEDATALAEIIRSLAEDHDLYTATARKCYERARQFDIAEMVERYNTAYSNS